MRITSTCEKEFISACISKNYRLDGRSLTEGRSLVIEFGKEWGCCLVSLGNTRVLAQVSSEVTEPKASSPTEGTLHINLEISAMSAPDVQFQSRMDDEHVGLQRILERCIRDSKCIDLESLCIVAGSKVWTIRVDVHALNDDGNLVECASLGAISALAHFKRPDVTVVGTDVTVHSLHDREPVKLNLHHMPICINLALFNEGEQIVTDPLDIEERIADGCYIIGTNAHQEECLKHRIGVLALSSDTVKMCENVATVRSQSLTQDVRKALDDDAYKRATKAAVGFVHMIQTGTLLGNMHLIKKVDLNEIVKQAQEESDDVNVMDVGEEGHEPTVARRTSALEVSQASMRAKKLLQEVETSIFEGGTSKWKNVGDEEDSSEEEISPSKNTSNKALKKEAESSSEEEDIVCVSNEQLDVKPANTRTWYSKDPFS